jgi:hypothetical protein
MAAQLPVPLSAEETVLPGEAVTSSRDVYGCGLALLVGANFTVTTQLAPGARAAVQVFAEIWNAAGSPGIGLLSSTIEAEGTPLAAAPVLVTVNACDGQPLEQVGVNPPCSTSP